MDKATAEATILENVVDLIDESAEGDLESRPGLDDIGDDLRALDLEGGPADEVALHDFHVLQVAFKDVWARAFDGAVYSNLEQLYEDTTALYEDAGRVAPVFDGLNDLEECKTFLSAFHRNLDPYIEKPACPVEIATAFPDALAVWPYASAEQVNQLAAWASVLRDSLDPATIADARYAAEVLIETVKSRLGRLAKLLINLNVALSEPYAFDVFAPNTYNYGIMLTYRQRWEPLTYQAGDLAATIALAPGESRKYSTRQVIKKSRAEKEIEKSMRSQADQASETGRAEAEIVRKASSATNFKLSSSGSFNVGIGSISASSEFAANQAAESASVKKQLHEATMKSAHEYRLERSLEVDTTAASESDATASGEISNPNNEITVTYLFYELQRRYRVSEHIHRARGVIMVAQDVPAPHEIDEAWLITHQWVIARVLLDDLFRPALEYLSTGFAGDEVATDVLRQNFETQRNLVAKLEGDVATQLSMRNGLRDYLIKTALNLDMAQTATMPTIAKVLTLGLAPDPGQMEVDRLEAQQKAGQTRLDYVEQALADGQSKLKSATDAMAQASRQYAEALQKKTSRHVAIDALRLHVKHYILYYMQAIWDQEPPDQRFFRLYRQKVKSPTLAAAAAYAATPGLSPLMRAISTFVTPVDLGLAQPNFTAGDDVDLVEVADLDNPLGYKGNYIIFPLKKSCSLVDFMLAEFVDEYFGVRDPDLAGAQTIEEMEEEILDTLSDPNATAQEKSAAEARFLERLGQARPITDEIIVPTGQLFIEALPGRHPLLEDFKLRHRMQDVRKVQAEVRHAELENLRLAARMTQGVLSDPDIDKQIVVAQGAGAVIPTDS
jgi:hypothetical protein